MYGYNELTGFLLKHENLELTEKPLLCLLAIKGGECHKRKGKEEVVKETNEVILLVSITQDF